MKSLVDLKNKVIEDVDYPSDDQMTLWHREVEQILLEVNSVQASMTASNQKLCGCFFNCSERYRLSKETARMLKEVERLLKLLPLQFNAFCNAFAVSSGFEALVTGGMLICCYSDHTLLSEIF
ncbi:hypothetical protein Q3G72_021601 [Acer saccharum]|nr:hypothetical protein Q3G72_021601 [Acer saccharum]